MSDLNADTLQAGGQMVGDGTQRRSNTFEPNSIRAPKPHRALWKSCALVVLAALHIGSNSAIIYATIHTYRFGARITKQSWWISDNNLITVIEICAKLLYTITALLGGWAVSHLWSKRLSTPHSSAGLAELQSLNIFQSIPTIFQAVGHLFSNHYISAQWIYGVLIICAVLLQLYSTAVVTLATPSIVRVERPPATYQYASSPYMNEPGYGNRCRDATFTADSTRSCLEIMLAGRVLTNVEEYDGGEPWIADGIHNLWAQTATSYISTGSFLGATLPVGPLNNVDLSAGAVLHGMNMATVERLLNFSSTTTSASVWNSVEFTITVTTDVPVLTCQCVRQDMGGGNTSIINIQGDIYQLGTPVPPLQDDQIVGQVTSDNMTLVLSVHTHGESSLTHCAVNLKFWAANMTISGSVVDTLRSLPSAIVSPTDNPWELGDLTSVTRTGRSPMRDFSDYWLGGLGWSSTPAVAPVAELLGGLPIGTGSLSNNYVTDNTFLEYYVLVMLSSGISIGFSPEPEPRTPLASSSRTYIIHKREYYLGAISPARYFFVGVIILDSFFVFFCVVTILFYGWLPDWTDPVTLVRTSLCSNPPEVPAPADAKSEKPGSLSQSPVVMLSDGRTEGKLWKEKYYLVEVEPGERGYLVFTQTDPIARTDSIVV